YIVLEKDFSNIDEVVVKLRDDDYITALTDRARMHLIDSGRWGFNAFIDQFDDVVDQETKLTPAPRIGSCLPFARAERLVRVPPPNVRIVRAMLDIVSAATGREFARRREIESGALLVKAAVALRAAVGEANLRPMFWEGRRARMSLARLLEELLDLYVLMCAVQGKSVFRETFTVTSQFDTAEGALRFISKAPESPRSNNESKSRGHQAEIDGAINRVEWDHSAVGGIVTLKRPEIRVGIGRDGLKRYDMLVEIGRRRPDLLRRALSYLIEMSDSGVAVTPEVHVIAPA